MKEGNSYIRKLERQLFLLICDVGVVCLSSLLALMLRFDFIFSSIPIEYLHGMFVFLPFLIVGTLIVFFGNRLYHSLWSLAGTTELLSIVAACLMISAVQMFGMMLLNLDMPRSYFLLYLAIQFILTVLTRFSYRFMRTNIHKMRNKGAKINIMIIGAGEAGNMLIKEIENSRHTTNIKVRCIIDDARSKQGIYVNGIRVVGTRKDIIKVAEEYDIEEIYIAMPSVSKKRIREIVEICKKTKCKLKTLPGVYQLLNDEVNVSKLRNVEIEDLLGRDMIQVDLNQIMGYVKDKVVLITGGGGSIGSELCRQIAQHNPKQLIIFDIYENNAYEIQQELLKTYPELNLKVLIGSVRNSERMNTVFEYYRPDIVYHAAAHKHVPLMEESPNEAIKNNVYGTLNAVLAADKVGVGKFVLISTDKAVNPTNIMGASKRICEMIVQEYNSRSKTEYVAVRFGNVLGSNGSVIPLFKKQIMEGGPVTVTHPDIIRYFMTVSEAVSLVLQAGAYAQGGEIFVLDMGEPVKIIDLAKNLIRLSGFKVNEDIMIEFSGLRPGEKLYEELLMSEEGMRQTQNKLIHIGMPIEINEDEFWSSINELKECCYKEEKDIRKLIHNIVPTYTYQKSNLTLVQPENIDGYDEEVKEVTIDVVRA